MFQVRWLWKNIDHKYRCIYFLGLFISLSTTVAGLINPFLSGQLVQTLFVDHNTEPMIRLLLMMLGITLVQQGARYGMVMCF